MGSVLLGILTQMVQTGSILGIKTVPKTWLPGLTLVATGFGGFLAYLTSQSPLALNAATWFYATMAGLTALLAGAAPGIAVQAHVVVPGHVLALRAARAAQAAPSAVAQAAAKIAPLGVLCLMLCMCNAIGPGIVFVGCVWNTYQGIPAGTPMPQVIATEIATCGGDGASVIVALDQREARAMHTKVAHEVAVAPAPAPAPSPATSSK